MITIHVPTPDPYVPLFGMLGGKPQILCHGDDLPAGAVATWDARHGALAGTTAGTPSSNASGWAGSGSATFRTLDFTTNGQWVDYTSEASNYAVGTSFLWIGASKFTASGLGRNVAFLGSNSTSNNYRGFTINVTNDFAYMSSNRNGTGEFDTASVAVAEGVQCVWAVLLKSNVATIMQRTSSGVTTLLSLAHSMAGALTVDRFTLGALILSGAQSGASAYGQHRFFCAMRSPTANAANLANITSYVQHNLRCPL